jgi:membrane protease YdiL (CAAX protease family)
VPDSEALARLPGADLVFIWLLAETTAFLVQSLLAGLLPPGAAGVVAAYLVGAGTLLGATLFWLAARSVRPPWSAGVPAAWVLGGLAAGVLLRLVGAAVTLAEQKAVARIVPNNPVLTDPGLFRDPVSVGMLVLAAVGAAPLAEEVFYRGVLFRWLRARLGVASAAVLSGLAFGAAHFDLPLLLPLAAVGAGLAVLLERSRSIWACWVAHACLNAISLALALATVRG